MAKDGTEVQDEMYFETIEPQTLFVIAAADVIVKTGENTVNQIEEGCDCVMKILSIFCLGRFSVDVRLY